MGKIRKTLRQKKQADLHTQSGTSTPTPLSAFTYDPTSTQASSFPSSSIAVPHIKKDLLKTLIVTSTIAIAELVLFFVI